MAYEGMVTLIVTVDAETGEVQGEPEIVTRGVRGFDSTNGSLKDARRIVAAAIAGASRQTLNDEGLLKEHVRVELKRFIQKLTGARPVIMPVVVQV
jgi:ribonuclease J